MSAPSEESNGSITMTDVAKGHLRRCHVSEGEAPQPGVTRRPITALLATAEKKKVDPRIIDLLPGQSRPDLEETKKSGLHGSMERHGGNLVPVILFPHPANPERLASADGLHRAVVARDLQLLLDAFVLAQAPEEDDLDVVQSHILKTTRKADKGEQAALWFRWLRRVEGRTEAQAALVFEVTEGYLNKGIAAFKSGIPELQEALQQKKIILTGAAMVAALTPEQ